MRSPPHRIGDVVFLAVAFGKAEPPRPRLAGLQAQLTHRRPGQLQPGRHTPGHQVRVDPAIPVRVIEILERLPDIQREQPAPFRRSRFRLIPPLVKAGT